MLLTLSSKLKTAAKVILTVAEVAMWLFVGFGICRVAENGVSGLPSFMLSISMALGALSTLIYLVASLFKIIVSSETQEARNDDK